MPDWKTELKAELGNLRRDLAIEPDLTPMVMAKTVNHLMKLCSLMVELIDHIPDEKSSVPFFDWEPKK